MHQRAGPSSVIRRMRFSPSTLRLRSKSNRQASWQRVLRWLVFVFYLPAAAFCANAAIGQAEQERPRPASLRARPLHATTSQPVPDSGP